MLLYLELVLDNMYQLYVAFSITATSYMVIGGVAEAPPFRCDKSDCSFVLNLLICCVSAKNYASFVRNWNKKRRLYRRPLQTGRSSCQVSHRT